MEPPDILALCLSTLPPVVPANVWRAWALAPETLLPLLFLLVLPWLLRRDGPRPGRGLRASWLLGWSLLAMALISPLCRLAATLASAHMLQHLILIVLAPLPMAPALLRCRAVPRLRPATATLLFGAVIWIAHAPPVYQAALLHRGAHIALLVVILCAALLFWIAILAADGFRGFGMIFATMIHSGLLGALLTFSPLLWYPVFAAGPLAWGLTPLEDQQLAGLIMWVPMGAALLVVGLWIGGRALFRMEVH